MPQDGDCSIGGLGTLVGSPPNALMAGFLAERHGIEIGFGRWLALGMPVVVVGVPVTWWLVTCRLYPVDRVRIPGAQERFSREVEAVSRWSTGERLVGSVFLVTALAWITRPLWSGWMPGLSDTGVALAAAVVLFILPGGSAPGERALDWDGIGVATGP